MWLTSARLQIDQLQNLVSVGTNVIGVVIAFQNQVKWVGFMNNEKTKRSCSMEELEETFGLKDQ